MQLNWSEVRDITKYEKGFKAPEIKNWESARGKIIEYLIVISHGRRQVHDSGYPFIKILGKSNAEFYDLGWHDHFLCYLQVNIDSYGKNVFRVMPWGKQKQWVVSPHFIPLSTFQIGDYTGVTPAYSLS